MRPTGIATTLTVMANLFAATTIAHADSIYYVDSQAPPGGNGSTWQTAYKFLQDALSVASTGDGIHIAAGTYTPDQDESGNVTPGDRAASFALGDGVALRGGYAGAAGGDSPDLRDVDLFPTVLSGDLNGDDQPGLVNNTENSYHVVVALGVGDATLVDGVTIAGGNANGTGYPNTEGGGAYVANFASPVFADCAFVGCSATTGGGASCGESSVPTFSQCRFTGNKARTGGGIAMVFMSGATLVDCVLAGNRADNEGGGVYTTWSNPTLTRCILRDNQATSGGGMYHAHWSQSAITNCLIAGNVAASYGGGLLANNDGSTLNVINCTVVGNQALLGGGGVYIDAFDTAHITNGIFWDNSDTGGFDQSAQIYINSATTTINHTLVEGWTGTLGGVGNTGEDPQFADADGPDGIFGTADDRPFLLPGSPCIDAGNTSATDETTDLLGRPRVRCQAIDMGACESAMGDMTCDQAITLLDFGPWNACANGPDGGPYDPACQVIDFDFDGDIDLRDLAAFQRVFYLGA